MSWDFTETNPFSSSTGNWMAMVDWVWKALQRMPATGGGAVEFARYDHAFEFGLQRYPVDLWHCHRKGQPLTGLVRSGLDIAQLTGFPFFLQ